MATRARTTAVGIALLALLIALAWSGAAAAKTGLAPVQADSTLPPVIAASVQKRLLGYLRTRGVDAPAPKMVAARLAVEGATNDPTTERLVAAGRRIGVDLLLVVRIRDLNAGTRLRTELRAIDVAAGAERRYERERLFSYMEGERKHAMVADALELAAAALADHPPPEQDLVAVEGALGRDCDEEYAEHRADPDAAGLTFAEDLYLQAEKHRRDGKIVAIAIPTVLVAATTAVLLGAFQPWRWDDHDDEQCDPACASQGFVTVFVTFGFVLVAVVGYGSAIGALAGGLHLHRDGVRDAARLRPLVPKPPAPREREMQLSLAPWASPQGGGVAAGIRF